MDIVLGYVGQFEIDDLWQLVDVQAARGNVCRHEDRDLALLEAFEGAGTSGLALVSMDGRSRESVLDEFFGESVGAMLGSGEHQHLVPPAFANDV